MKKLIHRIFFNFDGKGDPFLSYLETWKKELPDFEIMNWDATNLPLDLNGYTRLMAAEKNHAYLSDYFRCWLLREYGGVYLDADIEILDGNRFRAVYEEAQGSTDYDLFIGVESKGNGRLTAHSMGIKCGASHPLLDFLLNLYESAFSGPLHLWIRKFNIPSLMTLYFLEKEKKEGYSVSRGGSFSGDIPVLVTDRIKIYPQDRFSPLTSRGPDKVVSAFSEDTCLCHHFAATWTADAGRKTAKRFAEALLDGDYAIDPDLVPSLRARGFSLPRTKRLPKWALREKEIHALEKVLNILLPYDSPLFRILKKNRPERKV